MAANKNDPEIKQYTDDYVNKLDMILRTKCMIDTCKSNTWAKVLAEESDYTAGPGPPQNNLFRPNAPYSDFQMNDPALLALFEYSPIVRQAGPGNFAVGIGAPQTVPIKPYHITLHEKFRKHMLEDHVAVKQAHNIEMQCSGSSAGTVTHFPNYHID